MYIHTHMYVSIIMKVGGYNHIRYFKEGRCEGLKQEKEGKGCKLMTTEQ